MAIAEETTRAGRAGGPDEPPDASRIGPALVLWMILMACLHGGFWLSGWRSRVLSEAVEQGTALVESRRLGEVHDDAIRRTIRTQRDTLPFWTTLTMIGDFALDPLSLALRAAAASTLFAALAALSGRPVEFGPTLAGCVAAQGFWVLGLAVRLGLMVALGDPDAETSLVLALPAGTYPAPLWVALRQLDVFALLGWAALARCGARRGHVHPAGALALCLVLWSAESACRVGWTLTIESGMRLLLIPDWVKS